MSESDTEREVEPVVCPNPECHIDQQWSRRRVLCCPECASTLAIACEECKSPAIERVGGSPRCSDHLGGERVDRGKLGNLIEDSFAVSFEEASALADAALASDWQDDERKCPTDTESDQ